MRLDNTRQMLYRPDLNHFNRATVIIDKSSGYSMSLLFNGFYISATSYVHSIDLRLVMSYKVHVS